MAKPLPPGQARVLQAIAGLVRRGLSPTAHDLTRALGIRPQSLPSPAWCAGALAPPPTT